MLILLSLFCRCCCKTKRYSLWAFAESNLADTIKAKVNFIQQYFNAEDKTTTARVYLQNPNAKFKVGAIIKATLQAEKKTATWVPKQSVLDLGTKKVVFLKTGNRFKVTEVFTGSNSGNLIEIIKGISEADEIAANAQYLIDSEAFIKIQE